MNLQQTIMNLSISSNQVNFLSFVLFFALLTQSCTKKQDGPSKQPLVSTFAGSGESGVTDGKGTTAKFDSPVSVSLDTYGSVYTVDSHDIQVRRIYNDGTVNTFVGGTTGVLGGLSAIGVSPVNNVYVGASSIVDKAIYGQTFYSFVGTTRAGGYDGQGAAAAFSNISEIAFDPATGYMYVADYGNGAIRQVTLDGTVSTVPGTGNANDNKTSIFTFIAGVAIDGSRNIYASDFINNAVYKISNDGSITLYGKIQSPTRIAADKSGNVYCLSSLTNNVQEIDTKGNVSVVAGHPELGYKDGSGTDAYFDQPQGIAIDATGKVLYIADTGNNRIREVTLP